MSPQMSRTIDALSLFSWRVYLGSALVLVPAVVVPRLNTGGTGAMEWLLAAVAGHLALGLVLPVIRLSVARGALPPQMPVALVAGIGAGLGLIKGQVTALVALGLGVGLPGLSEHLVRSLPSAILGSALMVMLGLVLTAWKEFTGEWNRLVDELSRAESARLQEREHQHATILSLQKVVEDRLQDTLIACRTALEEARHEPVEAQWARLAQVLRSAADDHVRPLTRDLWRDGQTGRSAPSPWAALWTAREAVHMPVLWLVVITVLALVPAYSGTLAFAEAAGFALAGGGAAGLVLTAGNRILGYVRLPWVLAVSTTGALAGSAILMVGVLLGEDYVLGEWVFTIFWQSTQAVLATLATLVLSSPSSIVMSAQRHVTESRHDILVMRRATQRLYRDMAQYLHGTVQSRLMASALAFDSQSQVSDLWRQEHLRHADELLRAPLAEFSATAPVSLAESLASVTNRWSGVMDVHLELEIDEEEHATRHLSDICAVVEEALANASRHGLASAAQVSVSIADGFAQITVADDGVGPRAGEPGLGSALFDAVAPQAWTLTPAHAGASGSVFQMTLSAT